MKEYIPFILAGTAGLMLRTALSALAGEPYTMDGRDIFNAVICLLICYYVSAIAEYMQERRAQKRERRRAAQQHRTTHQQTNNRAA